MNPEPPSWQAAHDEAEAAGRDGYFDPGTSLFVMTSGYLRRRGTCCASRCRHCPYEDWTAASPTAPAPG